VRRLLLFLVLLASFDAPAPSRVEHRDVHGNVRSMAIGRDLIRTLTLATQEGPASVDLTVLVEDLEGHLWLGANGRGLHRVRPQPIVSGSQPQGLTVRGARPSVVRDRPQSRDLAAGDGRPPGCWDRQERHGDRTGA